ncbi:hypothetical protein LZG74_16810 [Dyadobacter sp. CY327]|uniref:hypothetical protein n=1 Tax=Dyadobacter sp. CY327 TaxID=2907301 RepID=UPI001F1B32BF|nr:hypothetical protein [Dyadobacter sp. CY327]MCE7071979.1 hypothetical protein [Dyadobacter sp. CY327]
MENQFDKIHVLFSDDDSESEPVAAFSDLGLAEGLAEYFNKFIEGGVTVKSMPSDQNTLPVDKYARLIEMGMAPFYVLLNPDGTPFGPADIFARSWEEDSLEKAYDWVVEMQEAETENPDKKWLIGGVFWAPDEEMAIERAILQHKVIFAALANSAAEQEESAV